MHAGVCIAPLDRAALERLSRYILRPPLALPRLSEGPDGRLHLRLETVWRDGTTTIMLTPSELLQRLVAPTPRVSGRKP